jgi:hypothetical protein
MKKFLLLLLSLTSHVALGDFSPIPENEDVKRLLEGEKEITSLSQMTKLGLNEGKTQLDLWSGHYWPLYQGSLGVRYRDPRVQKLIDENAQWNKFKENLDEYPGSFYVGRENLLSPAEKYDLLVGDPDMSLTHYSLELAQKNAIAGTVKIWRGICDGWASASQKMPRPQKSVKLKTPQGVMLTFYPEDIKALGSLMYARSQKPVIFLGKRCRNPIAGIFTGSCQETNPATFHKAVVNRVGNLKKSFIADVSPGSEVWNYPVEGYKVTYYNVFDESESENFEDVKEPFVKKQRFYRSARRHPKTYSIVGVKLEVYYKDMRKALLDKTDGPQLDQRLTKTYHYDLELDFSNNILGGESFSRNLPDFIWAPDDVTYPLSDVEENNPELSLVEKSQEASKLGQPLSEIVKKLFELSSKN